MSYESKIDAARKLITQHNESLGKDSESVNFDVFLSHLKNSGGTSEAILAACTWEDLENCGLPRLLARSVAGIFRQQAETIGTWADGAQQIVVVDDDPEKQAKKMKPAELVAAYDLEETDNPVGERLQQISKGRRFIVFTDDGQVNVPTSQAELQRLRDNYPERQTVTVEGSPEQLHRVGDRPDRYVDEHPVFRGTPLNPDGTSDKGIAWASLDLEIRQLVYLAIYDTRELNSDTYDEHDLFDIVSNGFDRVASRYPKAVITFKDLSKLGNLPKLKIQLGSAGSDGGTNNPFGTNKSY